MQIRPYRLLILCLGCLLLAMSIATSTIHAQEMSETAETTFAKLGYDDMRLQGLYSTRTLWIPFQSDWPVEGDVEIELTYIGSPLLHSRSAIVTVLANNEEITSFRPAGDGSEHTVSIAIPPALRLAEGTNITFAGHLRLTDDPCEDSFNIGQWLIIRNSSQVEINLARTLPPPELTDLPQALAIQANDEPAPIIFVLPEGADDLTLTAAARVAMRLGIGITADHLPIRVTTADSLMVEEKENANLVLVGLPDNQPLIGELGDLMPVPPTDEGFVSQDEVLIPATDGVVQIFTSPWHPRRHILLVSGNGADGLVMAGQAFADRETFQSLTGSFHFIRSLVDPLELVETLPWLTAQTSFAQLGESDRQATGFGITNVNYFFRYPAGVMLDETGQLVLHLAFSPALRAEGSYVEVSVNDIYIGAVDAATVDGNSWIAWDLPVQSLNELARKGFVRELNVQLSIANMLPVNNCEQVNGESSWATVYADSYFKLDFLPVDSPDLYFFPYPFVAPDSDIPVRFVLPGSPSAEELQTAFSVAALMGNQALTHINLDVIRGTTVRSQAYTGHHLILIGTTANNSALEETAMGMQTNVSDEIYQLFNAPQAGFFHALASPWDEGMAALAIFSATDVGFQAAAEALYQQGRLVGEPGSVAFIRVGEAPVVIYREAGLSQPQVVHPDIVLSEISYQGNMLAEPTATVAPDTDLEQGSVTIEAEITPGLTSTERLILVITAFLVILVTVAALIRIAWRIRA